MRKCYAVCDFLYEDNKESMRSNARECGFEIGFFENDDEARGHVSDGEVICCSTPELLNEMPELKWCHSSNAGVGPFVMSTVFDDGRVLLTNSSGAYGLAISEYIIMVTLMLMRRMNEYMEVIERREWSQDLNVRSIEGSNIAIIGTGDIGCNAAKRFHALGAANVTGINRSGRDAEGFDRIYKTEELDAVIRSNTFDVLVLCVPGTGESKGLLNRERIGLLSGRTLLVNVGRGTVLDNIVLAEALNSGRIAGAALDVTDPEPLPADHPLWTARNCILTPHMSGDMGLKRTVDFVADLFCDNLRRYAEGRKLTHIVDIKAGY